MLALFALLPSLLGDPVPSASISVCRIEFGSKYAVCSGFSVDAGRLVVTRSVYANFGKPAIFLSDGKRIGARLVVADKRVAILLPEKSIGKGLRLSAKPPRKGDRVYALGWANEMRRFSASEGTVMSAKESLVAHDSKILEGMDGDRSSTRRAGWSE